ncbi:carboxypeptidase-like regulatory domain-containing protein [Cecembia rubra]|uniref:Carboxypeptidase-like protein n=1 Tax=Cecembia rubra TaxID=1485585 RepID=A0A2P8EDS1_9BACT|nr:carboxypeptidase-like regulatory domain-containing protein [Cecembia rubra]PSL07577.1 carboxypeptidase-like protein [Cecembia rubra]
MVKLKFLIPLFVFCCSRGLFAQERFSITGIIKDGLSDQYVKGAVITIRETAYSAVSKEAGNFLIENVYPDRFVLNINIVGYQSYQAQINVRTDLDLGIIKLFPTGFENPEDMALQKTIRATNIAELFSRRPNFLGGNQVYGIPPEPKRLIGNFYLDTKWNKASILLYKDMEILEGYFVRYNISSNNFEMRDESSEQVTVIPGFRVQNIVWIDSEHNIPRYFVNGMDFREDGSPISGFFEVLVDGQMPLLRRTEAVIKPSNYNQALMIGERNDQIIKRNVYYYLKEREIIHIPKEKRKFFKIFGESGAELEQFVKTNSVNIRQPSGYFTIFTQYNSKFDGFESLIPKFIEN